MTIEEEDETGKSAGRADAEETAGEAPVSPESKPGETAPEEEPVLEIIKEPAECPPGETASDWEHVQKRTKRTSRKELFELIHRKNTTLTAIDKELKKTQQDLKAKEDRYLRLAAEFENYKKRTRREWELLQAQANADLIREIIGGIDNFDRAFAHYGEEDAHLREGLSLIHTGLMDILRKAGLSEIEALNRKFDPSVHEAVGEVESADVEEGNVAQVVQRGYRLHDTVLRPARVLVSRKKEHTEPS